MHFQKGGDFLCRFKIFILVVVLLLINGYSVFASAEYEGLLDKGGIVYQDVSYEAFDNDLNTSCIFQSGHHNIILPGLARVDKVRFKTDGFNGYIFVYPDDSSSYSGSISVNVGAGEFELDINESDVKKINIRTMDPVIFYEVDFLGQVNNSEEWPEPFRLLNVEPDLAVDVPISSSIVFTFNSEVDANTIDGVYIEGLEVEKTVIGDRIRLNADFDYDMTYTVYVSGVKNTIGTVLENGGAYVFTTEAFQPPEFRITAQSRTDKVSPDDNIVFTFNNELSSATVTSPYLASYAIDSNKLTVVLSGNADGDICPLSFTAYDIYSQTFDFSNDFMTKGGFFMTFDFTFVTTWMSDLVAGMTGPVQTILLAGLGLLGLIIGAFFLIGLGKKAVKKSQG